MIDYNTLTEKQQKRYDRILLIAEDLMYQQGFYKLSLTELTNMLKISRSTIYEYFDSKEGLAEKVIDKISERLNQTLDETVKNKTLGSYERFIQLAQAQSDNVDSNCYHLLNDLKIHLPELYNKYEKERINRKNNGYTKLIEQGIKEGLFDSKFDADFLVQLYLKMGQLTGDTDILDHISMNKQEAMVAIIKVFLEGTKKELK